MRTQELIESGILESHLLGFSTREEQAQMREVMEADQYVADYVADLEKDIKSYFAIDSVVPPEAVREVIYLRSIREKKEKKEFSNAPREKFVEVEVNDTHIKVHKLWRPAFIAVFILSKIFLIAGLYYYFKSASQADELQRLKQQQQQIEMTR